MAKTLSCFLFCTIFLFEGVLTESESEILFRNAIWNSWKHVFDKKYSNESDEIYRSRIFLKNFDFIRKHNQKYRDGLVTYVVRINQFSDLTPQEFAEKHHCFGREIDKFKDRSITYHMNAKKGSPDSIDWRLQGYVSPVKNQMSCGSCWAFSSTGSIEGQYFKKTGKLVSFSEQQLVDCSEMYGNHGCEGGLMTHAFEYLMQTGLETEHDYNYTAKENICRYNREKVVANITGYLSVPSENEEQLQLAVARVGPISIAIDANDEGFMSYSNGIFSSTTCSSDQLNHAVLLVGYDEKNGKPYWIVKNSWGSQWGMDGYIHIARNAGNMCGVATMASYPLI